MFDRLTANFLSALLSFDDFVWERGLAAGYGSASFFAAEISPDIILRRKFE